MVTMAEYRKYINSPITEQDVALCDSLINSSNPKPLDKMNTMEFLVFIKLCGHDLDTHFPDLTAAQLDEAFRDHIMDY